MGTKEFNLTQLDPDKEHRVHRDYLAHCLRWTHVLKHIKKGTTILDIGCGTGNLPLLIYKSRMGAWVTKYIGVDAKKGATEEAKILRLNFPAEFHHMNMVMYKEDAWKRWVQQIGNFNLIICFEVLEHMPKRHGITLLKRIRQLMGKDTTLLLSTPNYDGKHMAANHIYEWRYDELLQQLIDTGFKLVQHYGTFASQADLKALFEAHPDDYGVQCAAPLFGLLKQYYDSNFLSVIFAPLFPKQSRNILWRLMT